MHPRPTGITRCSRQESITAAATGPLRSGKHCRTTPPNWSSPATTTPTNGSRPSSLDGTPSDVGIRSFVVGTGGRSLYSFADTPELNSEVRLSEFGYLRLSLADDGYTFEFVAVDGTVLDSGMRYLLRTSRATATVVHGAQLHAGRMLDPSTSIRAW